MKILIVDDEELTRTGVIAAVDWDRLGIDEIHQADDGANGLKIAAVVRPDIILSDVRMPRMDGITMLERVEKQLPDTVVVFMSGYSDKEYLKAAIQLKAIDYIEKPIEPSELRKTLKKAVDRCNLIKLQNIADVAHESSTASELAYRFTMPYRTGSAAIDSLCRELSEHYGHSEFRYITSVIVRINEIPEEPDALNDIHEAFDGYLRGMNMHSIYTEKKSYNIIFYIYGTIKPTESSLLIISEKLSELMSGFNNFCIAVGETAEGKENAYRSYSSAVILLQKSFFMPPKSIITKRNEDERADGTFIGLSEIRELSEKYMKAIEDSDRESAFEAVNRLKDIDATTNILENHLKAIYHDMLLQLFKARRKKFLVTDISMENQETIMDIIDGCFSFEELQNVLNEKTENLFADTEGETVDNPTIRMICEFIADHYAETDLSVKSISDHAALSASYACTYFKNETGMTLNQYITDYRMKKAKQMLTDPRNKVNDISAAVGYSDGNYFTKSFRKYTGLTPSEYREQVIRS